MREDPRTRENRSLENLSRLEAIYCFAVSFIRFEFADQRKM